MAILETCCCGRSIREGSIVVGVLFSILHLIDLSFKANNMSRSSALGVPVSGTDAAGVTIDVVAFIIDGLMIYGVIKASIEYSTFIAVSMLLLVWVVFVVIILVAELIIVIVITAFARGPEVLIPAWIIYLLILGLVIYGVLVVYSHYQNLRDGVSEDDDGAAPPPSGPTQGTAASPPDGVYPQIWGNANYPTVYEMDRTRV
ncbi:Hypp5862 [Branchiostoma lanceolatum]|uniref:Hypp5862 protein n=1 Tax=Branchiostoma lanceolatum TaxID=7740 RepID=A0A8J9YR69_BRALA|nr:Hypp5862 [Branchiostoma lanceolatum]